MDTANLHAARGVAIREFPLKPGHGFADYLLYVDGKAGGVVEAKKQGATLTGVEIQSASTRKAFPTACPPGTGRCRSLYESTGIETHFTKGLDPAPRARNVFRVPHARDAGRTAAVSPRACQGPRTRAEP